jgi:hypothetical protein
VCVCVCVCVGRRAGGGGGLDSSSLGLFSRVFFSVADETNLLFPPSPAVTVAEPLATALCRVPWQTVRPQRLWMFCWARLCDLTDRFCWRFACWRVFQINPEYIGDSGCCRRLRIQRVVWSQSSSDKSIPTQGPPIVPGDTPDAWTRSGPVHAG